MIWKKWNIPLAAGTALLGLALAAAGASAAVLPDDEGGDTAPAAASGKAVVKVEEVCTDGDEAKVKVKVIGDGSGSHAIHWVGSPVKRGYLGVSLNQLSPDLQQHFGAPAGSGVLVGSVVEGSPAEAAGIQVGDVVTAVGDKDVASASDIQRIIREKSEGDAVSIALVRNGAPLTVQATVGTKEMQEFDISLLGDVSELQKNAFFVSSGMEGGNMVFKSVEGDAAVDPDEHLDDLENVFIDKIGGADDLIYFDSKTFNDSMKEVHEYLDSPEFQEKLKGINERELELQKRLEDLELKLEELEKAQQEKK